jgi:hypothetical protein
VVDLPIKKYWPTLARLIVRMCRYITTHRNTLQEMVIEHIPDKAAEVTAAFTAISSACALFELVVNAIDPNWRP